MMPRYSAVIFTVYFRKQELVPPTYSPDPTTNRDPDPTPKLIPQPRLETAEKLYRSGR